MNKKRKKEKGIIYLILTMVFAGICGFIFSKITHSYAENLEVYVENIENFIISKSGILSLLILGILLFLSIITYLKGKKDFLMSIKKEEDFYEEKFLSMSIIFSNMGMYMVLLSIALFFQYLYRLNMTYKDKDMLQIIFLYLIIYILGIIVYAILQKKAVNVIKKGYIEKRGDVYDINFQKDWFASMDEREKIETYYVGFKTFNFMNMFIIFLLIILSILAINIRIGIITYLLLLSLILVNNLVYLYYANKRKENIS